MFNELVIDRAELRRRIDAALQDSMDRCARCKACDNQVDAVMAVLDAESSAASSQNRPTEA